MNRKINKGFSILIIIILTATVIVGVVFATRRLGINKSTQPIEPPLPVATSPIPAGQELKTFQSSQIMKFSIEVPNNYTPVEKFGSVFIDTDQGKILIGQNATNFDNLADYIKYSRNNLEGRIKDKKELLINSLESTSGFIDDEKLYFIYVNNTVYSISTTPQTLYDELDQIVQSFRYTP